MKSKNQKIFAAIAVVLVCFSALALTRYPVYTASPVLIQSGGCNTANAGFVSNSFPIAYSVAPQVFAQQVGITNSPTNIVGTITTTGFCITNSQVNVSNHWLAIGTP